MRHAAFELTTSDGACLHYEKWGVWNGAAPRVLLLPPSNTSLEVLETQLLQTSLFSSFCCLTLDHRGIGKSSKPSASASRWPAPSTRVFADDALALLDAVGWSSCAVVGISFGGMIAQELVLARPQAVERLLLVCATSDVASCEGFNLVTLLGEERNERARAMLLLADTRRDEDWLVSSEGEITVAYVEQAEEALEELPGGAAGRAYQLRARNAHRVAERLREAAGLLPPTCIVAAVFDGIATPRDTQALGQAFGGAPLVWLEAGHWPNLGRERPRELDAVLRGFVVGGEVPAEVAAKSARVEARIDWARRAGDPLQQCSLAELCAIA
jgi:3-oxoadipate enol-lactonase